MVAISIILSCLTLATVTTGAPAKKVRLAQSQKKTWADKGWFFCDQKDPPPVYKCTHKKGNFDIREIDKEAALQAAPADITIPRGSGYPHVFKNEGNAIDWPNRSCAGEGLELLEFPVLEPKTKLHPTQAGPTYSWQTKPKPPSGYARVVFKVVGGVKEFCAVISHDGTDLNYYGLCPKT